MFFSALTVSIYMNWSAISLRVMKGLRALKTFETPCFKWVAACSLANNSALLPIRCAGLVSYERVWNKQPVSNQMYILPHLCTRHTSCHILFANITLARLRIHFLLDSFLSALFPWVMNAVFCEVCAAAVPEEVILRTSFSSPSLHRLNAQGSAEGAAVIWKGNYLLWFLPKEMESENVNEEERWSFWEGGEKSPPFFCNLWTG